MAYKHPENWRDFIDSLDGVSLGLGERAVLQAHYKYADKDGRNCRVTAATVAAYLRTSESTVRKYRSTLIKGGWLIVRNRGRNTGTENTASTFDIVIPGGLAITPPPKRAPRNRTGKNQHTKAQQVNGYQEQQVKQTSKPRSQQVTDSCLPLHPKHGSNEPLHNEDEEQQHSSIAVETGRPDGESGSAFADRDVGASGDEPLASGPHVAGTDRGSAPVSKANDFRPHEDRSYEDPWGEAPKARPLNNDELRDDLPEGCL